MPGSARELRSTLSSFFYTFKQNPWQALDNLDLNVLGFQFNLLRSDEKLRKAIFQIFFLIPLAAWVLLGADSTVDQVAYLALNTPRFLLQQITLEQLLGIYNSYYGLGTHWSAAVIYSAMLLGISLHLRAKLNIRNSLNLALTAGFVGIAIGTFEFFWQASYAFFQHQPWVLTFKFPQARILLQNLEFLLLGIVALIVAYGRGYRLNLDKKTALFALITAGLILLWWFYPFPTQRLSVEIQGFGTWISSQNFPQTMYTIQPNINEAFGSMYHIEDAGVHLVNNLTKIAMTLFFYSLFKIRRKKLQ